MTTKELYRLRYQQGATTTTEKRIFTVGELRQGRPIYRTVTLPSDDGATMTLRCTWGCGRTITEAHPCQ